jgi:hypothetical protein
MKTIYRNLCLMIIIPTLNFDYAMANPENSESANVSTNVVILRPKSLPTRPNAPSRNFIECSYDIGYLNLNLPTGVNYANVSISEISSDIIWEGYVSTDSYTIQIPVLSGEYEIDCTTDDGRVYFGTLIF